MKATGSRVILTTHVPWPDPGFVGWLAWHRRLGVTEVRVCAPRRGAATHPLLLALAEAGLLRVLPVDPDPDPGEAPRNAALRAAALERDESGGWGLFLLPDEYLCLDPATPDIPALMQGVDVLTVPVGAAGPGDAAALRSVVRLGLFGARTPEIPVGPAARDAPLTWLDGGGAPLPTPASRVAWARAGHVPVDARARVRRGAGHGAGPPARPATLEAEIAAILARPGIAAAQAALEAERRKAPAPQTPAPEAPAAEPAPAAPALPGWFAEIHAGGDRPGSYTRLDNHAVLHIRRDPARLVVTFDNLANVNDTSPAREPWAYRFVRESGASHLAVMARRKDWYRCAQLIAHLQGMAEAGVFAEPDRVWLTGTSMGGFGALAFASLAPGATVIAFSPQTTLDATLVPWETRFGMGRARNWSLPHSDAAFEIDDAARVFVLYDPFFAPDRRHVARLEGDSVIHLRTWCAGHFSPVFLRRAGLLKPVMQHALDGTLTPELFYGLYRARRRLPWYRKALQANAQERGHARLARRVRPAFRRLRAEAAE